MAGQELTPGDLLNGSITLLKRVAEKPSLNVGAGGLGIGIICVHYGGLFYWPGVAFQAIGFGTTLAWFAKEAQAAFMEWKRRRKKAGEHHE